MNAEDEVPVFRHSGDLPRLKALAFEAIREAGRKGAPAGAIATACLGAGTVPAPVAEKIAASLLEGDGRIEKDAGGRYRLRGARRARERGTPLAEAEFCVVDVETTGTSRASRILEVGAVRVKGLKLAEEFQTLVGVDVPIPPEITTLTGISAGMLEGAPEPAEALTLFCDFLGEGVFCAHNAPFDRRFVYREVEHFCLHTLKNPVLCTRLLARRALPGETSYALDAVARRLSVVNEMRHRALGDARAAAEILVASTERLMEKGVETLEDLLHIQRKPAYARFLEKRQERKP